MENRATSEDYLRDSLQPEMHFTGNNIFTPNTTNQSVAVEVTVTLEVSPDFVAYRKIPRYRRDIVITEKIDGTNAVIHISESGHILAGSRSRWIAPGKQTDNHGFAQWVVDHHEELLVMGVGYHFGEWYGSGINRGYGLQNGEKRLALFVDPRDRDRELPKCCEITPRMYEGPREDLVIEDKLDELRHHGSIAVPGFMRPEGIVIFDTASRGLHKITLENDNAPKGSVRLS